MYSGFPTMMLFMLARRFVRFDTRPTGMREGCKVSLLITLYVYDEFCVRWKLECIYDMVSLVEKSKLRCLVWNRLIYKVRG